MVKYFSFTLCFLILAKKSAPKFYLIEEKPEEKKSGCTPCIEQGYTEPPLEFSMKNWISLVPPCSILKCISPKGLKIDVEREITGPVRVNGYNITDDEHSRALNGEKVVIKGNEHKADTVLSFSGSNMVLNGTIFPGDDLKEKYNCDAGNMFFALFCAEKK
ncbi:uncharacterized protein LOC111699799 isoform X2 [Eurytemora carolleeae]|uniref:uncharacterized protein LOC111699799 isoform X2 n=1 Tax=Eurytemora carolleeae TaxID=1294199 RepID=UPI000C770821|nr:uncharacterized protein LOC111699799 isoform X2 [Eurytemora carolleeae]|eukprot:XP_023326300.1 uncharacterized protein LOC111699799 isoform X2 [Eurytemora affinis]